jgi:4-hydroxy-3-methylbut-2-enyl diphosphate reductase
MVEVARRHGGRAELVPDVTHFDPAWLAGVSTVGVSAGASAPEILVEQLVERLAELGYGDVAVHRVATEDVVFSPPARLTERDRTR